MIRNFSFAFTIICLLAGSFSSSAQNTRKSSNNNWLSEVRTYKHELLVKEADLTQAQQKEFLPLYTAMENEIYQANREARDFENEITKSKSHISDNEYEKAANALSAVKMKEAEIENTYYQKYSRILSKKQLFLLKRAENRFARNMLGHHRHSQTQQKTK